MDLRKASPANCQFPGLILNLLLHRLGEDSHSDNLNFSNFPKLSQSRIATTGSNCLKPHLHKKGAIMPPWPQWAAIKASLFPPWAARRSQSSLSFPVESWSVKNAGNLILSPAASFALLIMLLLWCTHYTGCVHTVTFLSWRKKATCTQFHRFTYMSSP